MIDMPQGRRYKKTSSRIAKREKTRQTFRLVSKIALSLAVLALLISLVRADFLRVKGFEVEGGGADLEESIKESAASFASGNKLFFIPKSNILLLDKKELAGVLLSRFTNLESVDVDKNILTKDIKFSVVERKTDFFWCSTDNQCFYMTKEGLVFEKAEDGRSAFALGKVIFKGVLEGDPVMKDFATPQKMKKYMDFIEAFKEGGLEITSINIEATDRAVASTASGNMIFNPEDKDLGLVAQNTILLLKDVKEKDPSAIFDYIDARFGNKIFYKLK